MLDVRRMLLLLLLIEGYWLVGLVAIEVDIVVLATVAGLDVPVSILLVVLLILVILLLPLLLLITFPLLTTALVE